MINQLKNQYLFILNEQKELLDFIKEDFESIFTEEFEELDFVFARIEKLMCLLIDCNENNLDMVKSQFVDFEEEFGVFTEQFGY